VSHAWLPNGQCAGKPLTPKRIMATQHENFKTFLRIGEIVSINEFATTILLNREIISFTLLIFFCSCEKVLNVLIPRATLTLPELPKSE
jgi:hypothetical protein